MIMLSNLIVKWLSRFADLFGLEGDMLESNRKKMRRPPVRGATLNENLADKLESLSYKGGWACRE